jgi:hypothetical protein
VRHPRYTPIRARIAPMLPKTIAIMVSVEMAPELDPELDPGLLEDCDPFIR